MTKHLGISLVLLTLSAGAVHAQSLNDVVASAAISQTPIGALPPTLTNTMMERLQNGGSLAIRYGHRDAGAGANSFAVTGILPAGLGSSFSLTGGFITRDCSGCSSQLMLGVGGDVRVHASEMGTGGSNSTLLTVTVSGDLGYGKPSTGNIISGYVGLPVALVSRGSGMQFVPFLTPGFAFGSVSGNGNSNSGSAAMFGGGIGIYNLMTNVTVDVGAQHIFVNGDKNMIGINVIIGGK